ncbi:taste receptor type 2 member 119-like [Heterocephalus glaber]|uniref:Taste receptor type 2 n=1 Tax=Heterocephalus glaber TaxID=10181 RepID=A0AAX6SYD4_HETGA|nr:taste receptor type 2 member 119-like [Heterocephalus glaber]
MLTPQLLIHFIIAVIQFLTGLFANGFIVVVNIVDLIKQRQMAPLDLLISCLATSRICLQVLIFLTHLVLSSFMEESVIVDNYTIFLFVNIWGLCLATSLGVFYCTKITTIPHPLFFWLKMRISKLVPLMILQSLLYASVSTGIHNKYTRSVIQKVFINCFSKNATQTKGIDIMSLSVFLVHLTVPIVIFLIAVLFLIFSLGRHTQHMRTIAVGTTETSRGIHFRAMLSIMSFLIFYFTHYLMALLFFFQILQFGSLLFVFCSLVAGTYPCIHSVILILGNPKLKQNAKIFLLCGQ